MASRGMASLMPWNKKGLIMMYGRRWYPTADQMKGLAQAAKVQYLAKLSEMGVPAPADATFMQFTATYATMCLNFVGVGVLTFREWVTFGIDDIDAFRVDLAKDMRQATAHILIDARNEAWSTYFKWRNRAAYEADVAAGMAQPLI